MSLTYDTSSDRDIRRARRAQFTPLATSLALCVTLLMGGPAQAQEFRLHVEPAFALWVDEPQSDRFTPGLYFAVRPGLSLGQNVDLQWSYALLYTPSAEGFADDGSAHFLTAGIRLRPFAAMSSRAEQLGGFFVDFNLGYVRTADLDRFGFDAGVGYGFQLSPSFSLGVVARYGHIVQPDDIAGQDPNDGQFMTIGLDLGFGPAYEEPTQLVCPHCADCGKAPICPVVEACADRDRDGVCDNTDRCPDAMGPPATFGCPIDPCNGPPLVVEVQFDYDSSGMPAPREDNPQTMDPVLDAVAKAIALDPSCRVCILGFASEEGTAAYNDALSGRRATAVQGYLHARGLANSRMPTHGLGERCQLEPEKSLQRNRRVEFRRLQDNESCPTDCSKSQR